MTNILTRTMDLVHEYNPDTHVHTFSYDTTYPVKVSGNIIKTFNATADFHHGDMFLVDNGSGKFTTIPFEKIYGFRQQLNVEEYFTVGEPVMVIFTLTDDDTDGCATICSLAPVEDTSNQGLFIQYKCNGIDDSVKINDALNILYNAQYGDDIEVLGAHIRAGYARDVVIEVTGAFKLHDDSITYHDDPDNDRKRYFSYINIAPEHADPYFTVHMDFSKAVIKSDTIRNTINAAASRVEGVGTTKSGYRAYLFEFDAVGSTPKFYLDNLRLDNEYLGLFASMIQAPEPDPDAPENAVDLKTINKAYVKLSNIHYVDTSNTTEYSPDFTMLVPAPMFLDNISANATIEMDTIDLVDISTDRWHLIANSGTCTIKNLTLYYGMSGSYALYKMHHIAGTLDSLICNVPECFNTNDPRRFTSTITDNVLKKRYVHFDRRNINTAQDFGYIFNEIATEDIEFVPTMSIVDSEIHVVNHNIISNIGGNLNIKGTNIEHTPVHFETDVCYENSAIMTYAGVLDIQTSYINLISKGHGIYGVHAMPLLEKLRTESEKRPQYQAANINCSNTRFFFNTDYKYCKGYSKEVDHEAEIFDIYDAFENAAQELALAFAIEQYCPYDFAGLLYDENDDIKWRRPFDGYYESVSTCNIIGCDFSADYDYDTTFLSSMCETTIKSGNFGMMVGNGIMYGKGKILVKVAECTCGMNGKRSVSPLSNCPYYGFYMIYNSSTGGMDITNSTISTCLTAVTHLPALDDRWVAKVLDQFKEGNYNFSPEVADFNLDGLVDTNDIAPAEDWLYYRETPSLNIRNSTIDNAYTSFRDDNKPEDSLHPYWKKLASYFQYFVCCSPSVYAEKVSSSSYSGNIFGGMATMISPCGSMSHLSFNNCTFKSTFISSAQLVYRAESFDTTNKHIDRVESYLIHEPPLGHFEASDASISMESCSFMKGNAACSVFSVNRMTPYETVRAEESNKIYKLVDYDELVFKRKWLYWDELTRNYSEGVFTFFADAYMGASFYNISNVTVNACNFVCDGNAIEYCNDPTMSFANTSRESTVSDVDWDITSPSGSKFTLTNTTIKTITYRGNRAGVNGGIVLSGSCIDVDIRNNLILTAGTQGRTSSNLAYSPGLLNMSDHFGNPSVHSSITFRNNTCCCCVWDVRPGVNVTTPYTKEEFLDLLNDNDYREPGDNMAHLMVYASNIIIYGSYVNLDICDNKFLKTRGTIGNRTVTSTSRRYDSSGFPNYVDYETTVIEHGILTEDISTTKALVSGRTILLGYHTLEKSEDSYEHYRNLHCKGKICNNQMGPQPGDGKIVISDEIGSRAMGAIQDGELYDSSSDISVHNIESGGWKDVEIECSGNYINEDLHSWNELSDGYRVDIDTKQFYK